MICRLCSIYATSSTSKERHRATKANPFSETVVSKGGAVYASSGQLHLLRISCTKSIQTTAGCLRKSTELILRWCSELTVPPVHGSTRRIKRGLDSTALLLLNVPGSAHPGSHGCRAEHVAFDQPHIAGGIPGIAHCRVPQGGYSCRQARATQEGTSQALLNALTSSTECERESGVAFL